MVAQRGCNQSPDATSDQISHVSHHLGSLLSAIESTVMCAYERKIKQSVTHIRETLYYTSDGFHDLPGWKIYPNQLQRKQQLQKTTCNPHHLLYSINR